jgi:outer membrane protein assembly factor BamD (BamD/ComL family)
VRSLIIKKRSDDFGYPKMLSLKELLRQEIDNLNEEQLKELSDFIAFLKFRSLNANWQIDKNQIAAIYSEFAEEDRQLGEEGLDEYGELLRQEDVK